MAWLRFISLVVYSAGLEQRSNRVLRKFGQAEFLRASSDPLLKRREGLRRQFLDGQGREEGVRWARIGAPRSPDKFLNTLQE